MISDETREVLHTLNDRCEAVLQCLRDIVEIHRDLNVTIDRENGPVPAYLPNLHKAMLHIGALASWQMDGEVLHVMASEIRVAASALDNLVRGELMPDIFEDWKGHSFLLGEDELAKFVHPTRMSLVMSREHGGFDRTGYVKYLLRAYISLEHLMMAYGLAVGIVAVETGNNDKAQLITDMVVGENEMSEQIDIVEIMKFADG